MNSPLSLPPVSSTAFRTNLFLRILTGIGFLAAVTAVIAQIQFEAIQKKQHERLAHEVEAILRSNQSEERGPIANLATPQQIAEPLHRTLILLADLDGARVRLLNSEGQVSFDTKLPGGIPSEDWVQIGGSTIRLALTPPITQYSTIEVSLDTKASWTSRHPHWPIAIYIALAGLLTAAALALWLGSYIAELTGELKAGAELFAGGHLDARLEVPNNTEFGSIARTLNVMAEALGRQLTNALKERSQTEAILSSMIEGVIALDREETIIQHNLAAQRLLGNAITIGATIQAGVRSPQLHALVRSTLVQNSAANEEIIVTGQRNRYFSVTASPLEGNRGDNLGCLLVFHDMTTLRRLETMRSDFVANVSHELRTPITSIKGFVETLLNGALDDTEHARHFLGIVKRQSDRLSAIIDDLLSLSRLEEDASGGGVELSLTPLKPVLTAAVETCTVRLNEKQIATEISCPDDLATNLNEALLEQAVVNLIDNAIKHTEPGTSISIKAGAIVGKKPGTDGKRVGECGIEIAVTDHGCGIPQQHLDRLFERFYRVDSARSRKQGGTGLGLAIVKHIAQVHGGHVQVTSTVGLGSTFTILLP